MPKKISGTKEWAVHSLNCINGCSHDCHYCVSPETLVLMYDLSTKVIAKIEEGDQIYGVMRGGMYAHLTQSTVLKMWYSKKRAWEIQLSDGRSVICSGDHRWMSDRGWKYTYGTESGSDRRPFLTKSPIFNTQKGFYLYCEKCGLILPGADK